MLFNHQIHLVAQWFGFDLCVFKPSGTAYHTINSLVNTLKYTQKKKMISNAFN